MFDKLIESDSVQAEFKPRRKFFMVSSVIVGIAFISAVVASLYAQDLDLGTNHFEIAEIIAPVAPDAPEPETPREPKQTQSDQNETAEVPNRPVLIERVENNTKPPDSISTVPSNIPPIPDSGVFTNDPRWGFTDGNAPSGPVGDGNKGSSAAAVDPPPAEVVKAVEPPPPPVARKPPTVSKGVINGEAKSLPKPIYPAIAKSVGVAGDVQVQVLIDEQGSVVSAHAINGPMLLRSEAEKAARKARFGPTLLSDQPVKVTGIITYRFAR
jgi:periplasmic protein TonB